MILQVSLYLVFLPNSPSSRSHKNKNLSFCFKKFNIHFLDCQKSEKYEFLNYKQ